MPIIHLAVTSSSLTNSFDKRGRAATEPRRPPTVECIDATEEVSPFVKSQTTLAAGKEVRPSNCVSPSSIVLSLSCLCSL